MNNYSFIPKFFLIQSIQKGLLTIVTFTTDHDYTLAEYVSFRCSDKANGMREINNQRGKVLEMTSDTITVNIDSTNYTDFTFDLSVANVPMTVPAGSGVDYSNYVPTVILGDVFDNIKVNT